MFVRVRAWRPVRDEWVRAAAWLLPICTAWVLFCTLRAAAFERIRTLQVVESYGFAVYEQLIHNAALHGEFFQTIHRGYIDHWMWSGHRSLLLYVASWLYAGWPEPITLATFQVAMVSLGCLPAFGLGRRVIGGGIGGAIGLMMYAGFPPLWVIALNDYQDVVLGVPFAIATVWALRERSVVGFVLAGFGCAMAREEWALTLPILGFAATGGWRPRLGFAGLGVAVAGVFAAIVWFLGRDAVGYETPMNTQFGAVLGHLPPIQRTWADVDRFYIHFLRPATFVAALAPLTALPAAGAFLVHLTTPNGSGIDADWRGHIHHMAPIAALLIAASIDGFGAIGAIFWPFRGISRWRALAEVRGSPPRWAALALLVGLGAAFWVHDRAWVAMLRLHPTFSPILNEPVGVVPEWALAESLPEEAVLGADQAGALLVSGFTRSFTYGESLDEKSKIGLREFDYCFVNRRDPDVAASAVAFGAVVVKETRNYQLYRFPKADRLAVDPYR